MRGSSMDLLWRIITALSFDCLRHSSSSSSTSSSSRCPSRLDSSGAPSLDSSSVTLSLGPLGAEPPRCQGCVCVCARVRRLSCGHLYCGGCCDRIVNQAFQDIEGLEDFPCPLCRALRRLAAPGPSVSGGLCGPYGLLQQPGGHWG